MLRESGVLIFLLKELYVKKWFFMETYIMQWVIIKVLLYLTVKHVIFLCEVANVVKELGVNVLGRKVFSILFLLLEE